MGKAYFHNVVMQSAAAATGNGTVMDVAGLAMAAFQVSGTFAGTVTFEGTVDGSNWVSLQVCNAADGSVSTTATAPGVFIAPVAGLQMVRARISAYTSGTITVHGLATTVGAGLSLADIDVAGTETVTANQGTAGAAAWPTTEQEAFIAGHERLTLAGASAALAIPGTAKKALIAAEGGDVRYAPSGTASATSPGYIPAGSIVKVPPPAAVYGATGSYANVVYLA